MLGKWLIRCVGFRRWLSDPFGSTPLSGNGRRPSAVILAQILSLPRAAKNITEGGAILPANWAIQFWDPFFFRSGLIRLVAWDFTCGPSTTLTTCGATCSTIWCRRRAAVTTRSSPSAAAVIRTWMTRGCSDHRKGIVALPRRRPVHCRAIRIMTTTLNSSESAIRFFWRPRGNDNRGHFTFVPLYRTIIFLYFVSQKKCVRVVCLCACSFNIELYRKGDIFITKCIERYVVPGLGRQLCTQQIRLKIVFVVTMLALNLNFK